MVYFDKYKCEKIYVENVAFFCSWLCIALVYYGVALQILDELNEVGVYYGVALQISDELN